MLPIFVPAHPEDDPTPYVIVDEQGEVVAEAEDRESGEYAMRHLLTTGEQTGTLTMTGPRMLSPVWADVDVHGFRLQYFR